MEEGLLAASPQSNGSGTPARGATPRTPSSRDSMKLALDSAKKKHVHHHVLSEREETIMNAFEALDYDVIENKLFEREQLLSDAGDAKRFTLMTWIVFFFIGFGTGTTAFLIDTGVDTLLEIRWDKTYDTLIGLHCPCEDTPEDCECERTYCPCKGTDANGICLGKDEHGNPCANDGNVPLAFFWDVLICGLYVGVSSGLVVWVEPAAAGSGIPDMKGYLNGTNLRGALTCKALVAKAVGVVFAVGGGLCVGKEGPLVHTGSVLGANISHGFNLCTARFKKWNRFRNDSFKRDFVSGGCAAGVAAAFGAPMGGVLFAFEEASSFWSLPLTWKCFFCAATSTFTLNLWLAWKSDEGVMDGINSPNLITFGTFKDQPYALWEIPFFALLAVVGGLLGALFNELNQKLSVWRRDRGWEKWQKQVECILTAMLTGAVFFALPRFFNDPEKDCLLIPDGLDDVHNTGEFYNRYECDNDHYNSMASMSFAGQEKTIHGFFHSFTSIPDGEDEGKPAFVYGTTQCIVYLLCYFTLAVWTYGIQVPSGLFVPGIITGCAFGRLAGEWVRYYTYDPNCYDTFTDCVTVSPATCCTEGRACNTCWFDENGPKCSNNKPPDDDNCVSTFLGDPHNGPVACPDECAFQPSVQRDCVKLGEPMINGTHSHGEHDLCHIVHPGTYAFIGATCMLGGMTRMTVSLCVILMETTNNIQYLLPIMLTLSLSKWVGDIFNISLYDMHVEIKCIPFLEFKPPVGMEQLHAQDLMSSPVVTVQEVESAENIVRMLEDNDHNGFPVLRRGTRKFVGMVLRSQLVVLLKLRAFCGPDGLRNPSRLTQIGEQGNDDQADCSWFGGVQVTSDDFATKLQSEVDQIAEIGLTGVPLAGKFIDMRPIMNPRPFSVGEETSLVRVFRLCRAMGIRHLPVVSIDNEVVGILTRKELRADFTQDLY